MDLIKEGEQLEDCNYIKSDESIISGNDVSQCPASIEGEDKSEKNASGSLYGKFNNAEDLLTAYNNLQAEFTRKCQKLSELKKSEPLQQSEYLSNDWDDKVAQFINQNQNARKYAKEICEVLMSDSNISQSKDSLNLAYQKVLSSKYKEPEDLLKDENFIKKVVENELIKKLVLSQSVKNINSPPSVMGKTGATLLRSKVVPNSLDEAGQIVLGLFKNKK